MTDAAYEYERIITGKQDGITRKIFKQKNKKAEVVAAEIIRYAIDTHTTWSPEYARAHFSQETITDLKLTSVVDQIPFPPELDRKKDFYYYIIKAYPERFNVYDPTNNVIAVLENVISKKLARFPKNFFAGGNDGVKRAQLCLRYAIGNYMHYPNTEALYRDFGEKNGKAGKQVLKECGLLSCCQTLYESPLDYLHDSLYPEERNHFLYKLYRFDAQLEKAEKDLRH